ncbi:MULTISPECIES: recombinase family protein [unclassified Micromonospora]|uniref:recombinase family protein n=1 Tax=unclassified Micromonospora TaxID=2617518 RepID=UPI003333C4D7
MFEDYLYARISEDEIGTEKGVTRQLRDSRDVSEKSGGRVVDEFFDNDISALEGAPRPGYERLLVALAAPNPLGAQRRIVCVHTSRIWRNRSERAAGIEFGKANKIIVKQVNGQEFDLRTAQGRMFAGIVGETDTGESEVKAERVADVARERAEEGRANGQVSYGWQRIYEYNSQGKVVGFRDEEHLEQADIVREIVDRLLAGETLKAITADLNDRGVPAPRAGDRRKHRAKGQTPDGQRWGKTSVKKLALRPANVGLRIFHRGRPDEALLPAAWPKIVDADKHDLVVALLTDPSRVQEKPGARQHLLTWGIGECGPCGAHLRVSLKGNAKHGTKQRLYVCEAKGCVGRNEEAVDRRVRSVMVALLGRPDVMGLLDGSAAGQVDALKRVEVLKAKLARAAAQNADDLITDDQLRVITGKLRPQLQAAEAAVRSQRPSPHLSLVVQTVGEKAAERWDACSITQKRAIMEAFGVRVRILPTRRGPGFDPESVEVKPRDRKTGAS